MAERSVPAHLARVPAHLTRRRIQRLRRLGLTWFDREGRAFAFRGLDDPYAVLVSEIVMQQTQVSRGEPAWRRFMASFPTLETLAAASPANVLRAWAGLGYNRRALNLHRAARVVQERHGGRLPDEVRALEALPGVGPYTARAVAAIAFGRPVGALDTNARRVLGRVLGGSLAPRELQAAADALVAPSRPAAWTAALMDIGATLCRPLRPACPRCPFARECRLAQGSGATRAPARPRRAAEPAAPYASSSRWLRGRIVARLRELPDGEWLAFDGPLGTHSPASVRSALEQLKGEELLELDADGRARLPQPGPA